MSLKKVADLYEQIQLTEKPRYELMRNFVINPMRIFGELVGAFLGYTLGFGWLVNRKTTRLQKPKLLNQVEFSLKAEFAVVKVPYHSNSLFLPWYRASYFVGTMLGWLLASIVALPASILISSYYGIKNIKPYSQLHTAISQLPPPTLVENWLNTMMDVSDLPVYMIACHVSFNNFMKGVRDYKNMHPNDHSINERCKKYFLERLQYAVTIKERKALRAEFKVFSQEPRSIKTVPAVPVFPVARVVVDPKTKIDMGKKQQIDKSYKKIEVLLKLKNQGYCHLPLTPIKEVEEKDEEEISTQNKNRIEVNSVDVSNHVGSRNSR